MVLHFIQKKINEKWFQPYTKKTSNEILQNDNNKKELLENLGFEYYVVWSNSIDNSLILDIKNKIIKKYEYTKN